MARRRVAGAALAVRRVLDVAWYLGVVAAVAAVAVVPLAVVPLAVAGLGRVRVRVSMPAFVTLDPALSTVSGAGRAGVLDDVSGEVTFPASVAAVAAAAAVVGIGLGLGLLVLHQLRRLFAAMAAGDPFAPANPRRIRVIGVGVLAAELMRALVLFGTSWWARGHLQAPGVSFRLVFPVRVEVIFLGVVLVLLAEVFRRGRELQHDHDLTI